LKPIERQARGSTPHALPPYRHIRCLNRT